MSTLKTINIIHPTGSTNNMVSDAGGNVTVGNNLTVTGNETVSGNLTVTGTVSGNLTVTGNVSVTGAIIPSSSYKRNRIINGNMLIDQRYGGTQTGTSISGYTVDRFTVTQSVTGKLNAQQSAAVYPVGFTKSLSVTSQSAYTVGTTDYYAIQQAIEGLNVADLAWGTANAKTVTLSFQAYSSLTGTFGGSLRNSATNRSYPFTYTISSANTWTPVSITVAGDTTGTWLTDNGVGLYVCWGLGVGSQYNGTAGAWAAQNYISATGAVSVVGTNGATFFITGVQLEVGTIATPYERQIYSDQLAQCQRYYEVCSNLTFSGYNVATAGIGSSISFKMTKRSTPELAVVTAPTLLNCSSFLSSGIISVDSFYAAAAVTTTGNANFVNATVSASAEL